MTEMTNPAPSDPAGLPAALAGHDEDGDPVDAPPAARPDGASGGTSAAIGMITGRHAGESAVTMPIVEVGAALASRR